MAKGGSNGRPPRLRTPMSAGARLALIGAAFVAVALGIAAISRGGGSGGGGGTPAPPSLPENASDVANFAIPAAEQQVIPPDYHSVTQDGVSVVTVIPGDWSNAANGRQIIFTDPAATTNCLSFVMPREEYDSYVSQYSNGFLGYAEAGAMMGVEAGGQMTDASPSITPVVLEALAGEDPSWSGARVVLDISGGDQLTRRTYLAAASVNESHAATLTCGRSGTGGDADLETLVRGYRLAGS